MASKAFIKVSPLVAICLLFTVIHVQAGEGTVRSSGNKKSVEQIYFLEAEAEDSDPIVRYLREDETLLRPVSDEQRRSLSIWSSFMSKCIIDTAHHKDVFKFDFARYIK